VLVQFWLDEIARNRSGGFGTNSGAFFRFTGPIDPGCLPVTPADSVAPGSALQWVNIEPGSPAYGTRIPLRWRFTEEGGAFIGPNALTIVPVPGFVAAPRSHYAVILTESVCDRRGRSLLRPPAMRTLLAESTTSSDAPELVRAHGVYAPLRRYLADVHLTGVVVATVYTTGEPVGLTGRARTVLNRFDAPVAGGLHVYNSTNQLYELRGSYIAPNFQRGAPPYLLPRDGGDIAVDGNGDPVPARQETLRFALTVPRGAMPAGGWPLVIYAHGTGGDYRTFIGEGLAALMAAAKDLDGTSTGLAMISIDQNLHGPRDPSSGSPELLFFNIQNPTAAVHNVVQSAIDDFSLLRMARGLVASRVHWATTSTPQKDLVFDPPLRFDPQRTYFMGHSQGGLTGPGFIAYEPEIRGAMLSGAGGGVAAALLGKTKPFPLKPILKVALSNEDPDEYHPLLNLIQQMLEPADPLNYAALLIRQPPSGLGPKHVFLSEGLVDHYTPNPTTEALAVALQIPIASPVLRPIDGLALRGVKPAALPLAGNLAVSERAVTAALLQYQALSTGKACSDQAACSRGYCDEGVCRNEGHFVIFDDPRGQQDLAHFFASMVRSGVPTLGP
jgi:hypothetical protein